MKTTHLFLLGMFLLVTACQPPSLDTKESDKIKKEINAFLDAWHKAAADGNHEAYINAMDTDAVYIGTDATEYWTRAEFKTWSKPYFDKKKHWKFSALRRNVYLTRGGKTAWFDELLDTKMGVCRGSGILQKNTGQWLIKHYVLSVTIPNDSLQPVIALKKDMDSVMVMLMRGRRGD
jgi:hypothetical protein